MNIPAVNTSNTDTNFKGKLIAKGFNWNTMLKSSFKESPELKELSKNVDIVGRISTKKVKSYSDFNHYYGQTLYKLKISILKENSILDRIKDSLHLIPRKSLTKQYHSQSGLIARIDDFHVNRLTK